MKKIISLAVATILFALCFSVFTPAVGATTVEDLYATSQDGDLLMTVDFSDKKNFESDIIMGEPIVEIDPLDGTKVAVGNKNNKSKAMWGGTIPSLPLNDTTNYTIHYTVLRNGGEAFGFYIDSTYGSYGYVERVRLMKDASSLVNHDYVNYSNIGLSVPEKGQAQEFMLEVCGVRKTIALYVRTLSGNFELVDESVAGEIPFFTMENLGVYFYTYYTDQTSYVSNVMIYRGLEVTGPVEPEATSEEESKAEEPSDTVTETETSPNSEEPSNTEEPSKEPEATKNPAASETENSEKTGGCSSAIISSAAVVVMACAAAVALKKKH